MTRWLIAVQVATFVLLGAVFMQQGQWRLGFAQILLAVVQAIIYTGKMV